MQPRFITEASAREAAIDVLEEAVDPPEIEFYDEPPCCEGVVQWRDAVAMFADHDATEHEEPVDADVEIWRVSVRVPSYQLVMAFDRDGTLCAAGLWP